MVLDIELVVDDLERQIKKLKDRIEILERQLEEVQEDRYTHDEILEKRIDELEKSVGTLERINQGKW